MILLSIQNQNIGWIDAKGNIMKDFSNTTSKTVGIRHDIYDSMIAQYVFVK